MSAKSLSIKCSYEFIHNGQKLETAPRVHHQEKSQPDVSISLTRSYAKVQHTAS